MIASMKIAAYTFSSGRLDHACISLDDPVGDRR